MNIIKVREMSKIVSRLDRYTSLATKLGSYDKDRALKEVLSEMAATEIRAAIENYLDDSIRFSRLELEDYGVDVEA